VIPLQLPPLRERRADVLPLARHFLAQLADGALRLAPDAAAALTAWPWRGNVRELRNVLERSAAFVGEGALNRADLSLDLTV
jgi:DNA-binding NtrC family response regulator